MEHLKKPVINLEVEKNGKKKYTTFFEGTHDMANENDSEFGIELLLNIGNFSSLRMIAKRHSDSAEVAGEQIIKDILVLKRNFVENYDTLVN